MMQLTWGRASRLTPRSNSGVAKLSLAIPATPRLVLADLLPGARVRDALLVVGGAGLTGAAAQVAVPIPGTPVPLTLQTFAVLAVGGALGCRRALTSMGLYVAAGVAGVPWFAGQASGVPVATFGYLLGFVTAAAVVGRLAERGTDRTPVRTVWLMLAGSLVIYAFGVPVLMASAHLSLPAALAQGVYPFLLGDAVKAVAAAGVLPGAWWLAGRREHR